MTLEYSTETILARISAIVGAGYVATRRRKSIANNALINFKGRE